MPKRPLFFLQSGDLEGVMELPTDGQMSRLPKRFPAGTVYVVEGRGGQYGRLRVSTRYVIMPGGRRVDIPAEFGRTAATGTRRGRLTPLRGKSDLQPGAKKPAARAKKFEVVAGTAARK